MNMRKVLPLVVLTIVALATVRVWSAPQVSRTPDSKEVSDLLSQARTQAVQLKGDASDMESFTHSPNLSWDTRAHEIMTIRDDVNEMGKTVAKLNNAQAEASPWQKTAIGRINPILQELADNVGATINHLDAERGQYLNTPEHQEYLKTNAELAAKMSTLVSDFVDYGQTREKFQTLSRKLELSERGGRPRS